MANVDTHALGSDWTYLILLINKTYSDSTKKFCKTNVINMLEFFNDDICPMFGGCVFQQTTYLWVQTTLLF